MTATAQNLAFTLEKFSFTTGYLGHYVCKDSLGEGGVGEGCEASDLREQVTFIALVKGPRARWPPAAKLAANKANRLRPLEIWPKLWISVLEACEFSTSFCFFVPCFKLLPGDIVPE